MIPGRVRLQGYRSVPVPIVFGTVFAQRGLVLVFGVSKDEREPEPELDGKVIKGAGLGPRSVKGRPSMGSDLLDRVPIQFFDMRQQFLLVSEAGEVMTDHFVGS